MTSQRAYREALPEPQALEIIERESGSHFDPKIVSAACLLAD